VEPGTNPGFLYQQNTMRDALAAGITLNILNRHNERVHMANLAQTINVLQALILTREEQMLLTPTYHVYDMYQAHQDAERLEAMVVDEAGYVHQGKRLPQVSVSASRDAAGRMHLSLCNLDPTAAAWVQVHFSGIDELVPVSGRILSAGQMSAHNTFERPEAVQPRAFQSFSAAGSVLTVELDPMSVVVLQVEG
jgi:alpha-N-arabinofuranosidase